MGDEDDVLAFFGNSPTRLAILESLAAGPKTRSDLQAAVDTSRTTLWRLVVDLEERGWVRKAGEQYEATVAGRIVVDRVTSLQTTVTILDELADLLDWLPIDEMSFPVERLANATVVRPTTANPQGPMQLATRQIETATQIRILSRAYSPWVVEAVYEPVLAGDQSVTMVLTTGVVEAFNADESIRRQVRDMAETDHLRLFRADEIPFIVAILDGDRVGMGIDDDDGRPRAVLDIEDQTIVTWAIDTYERYRDIAVPIGPERFSG